MTKRPDSLETVRLALELLRRIPRNGKIDSTQLHKQLIEAGFDRDKRTIQRQLEILSEHFDIERDDRNKPYGYRWLSHAKGFSIPNLSAQGYRHPAYEAAEVLLKGPEIELPNQATFTDKDGHVRDTSRIKWWLKQGTQTAQRTCGLPRLQYRQGRQAGRLAA